MAFTLQFNPKDGVIADVACGTAIWLLHVARELPDAHLEGFDIDLTRGPSKKSLPSNVSLREWNIFDDVPSDVVGKYEYVHVRLLILVIENSDTSKIIANLLKLLKPGGYLQSDELDDVNIIVKRDDPAMETPALNGLLNLCRSDGRYDWSIKLDEALTKGGFRDAKLEKYGDSKEIARAFNDQHMLTMEEFATTMAKVGQTDMSRKIQKMISDALIEAANGPTLCVPRLVVTA